MIYPSVIIDEKGEGFLRNGQMWMFKNNVYSLDESLDNGQIVDVRTINGEYLGTGHLSKVSHITVRLLSKTEGEEINENFFYERINAAIAYRKTIEPDNMSNCRLIFGEADLLPGLTVDKYNDVIVTQLSTLGMDINKDLIYKILLKVLKDNGEEVNGIYERNDVNIRSKEGLDLYKGFYYNNNASTKQVIMENGIKINVDIENGQKTGYFLDQKTNRYLVQKIAHGKKVLDCFTHTGGFALNAAKGNAEKVTAVDVSQTALDQGYTNAKMNGLENKIEFVKADVFKYLDTIKYRQFDIIILDPPAFTKSRRTIDHAYNGYKEINLKAMKALGKGGFLITCSCSRFMEIENFEKMLREAAAEANVTLKQVSVTQQNGDHPILWTMSETQYLKFYIFQLV